MIKRKPEPIARPTGALTRENVQLKAEGRYSVDATLAGQKQSTETAETEEVLVQVEAREDFTKEAFLEAWKELGHRVKEDHDMAMFTAMTGKAPELVDCKVTMMVSNITQQERFGKWKTFLTSQLRSKLKNGLIELDVRLLKQEETTQKLLSSKDRYDQMVEKNPALEILRKKLDLDLDL
ncbi:MAG: hypothetical protein AAF193_04190 [Bacteroidota bacterium]